MPERATIDVDGHTVHLAFSDRSDGDFAIDSDALALEQRRVKISPHRWTWLAQVHGNVVVEMTASEDPSGAEADAVVSSVSSRVLAVQTADCAPVLMWASGPSGPIVAAAHAGWKGLYEGILESTVQHMRSRGAQDIHAVLGPCIGAAAYEFSEVDLTKMALRFGPDVVASTEVGRPSLDMCASVKSALASCRVELICSIGGSAWGDSVVGRPLCTATAVDSSGEPRFFSWRARQDPQRQTSAVWIEA